MQAKNSKVYIAILLMGICIIHATTAAPTKDGAKDDSSDESKEGSENHSTTAATSLVDSKVHNEGDSVQVPVNKTGVSLQVLPPQQSADTNPSAPTHSRVKRNKNPIRYHAKNVRRQ